MLKEGLSHTSRLTVAEILTARSMGSGDLEVLATPAMTALMENAAMKTVADELPEGSTTVGGMISCSHLKPSPLGAEIEATARLEKIEGRKLTFRIEARQDGELIGEGTHIRFVVDRERFMSKLK